MKERGTNAMTGKPAGVIRAAAAYGLACMAAAACCIAVYALAILARRNLGLALPGLLLPAMLCAVCLLLMWHALRRTSPPTGLILLCIAALGLCLKLLWLCFADPAQMSDFAVIQDGGHAASTGDFSAFRGHGYFARFPHLSYTVLFFALLHRLPVQPIAAVYAVNTAFAVLDILLVFLTVREATGCATRGLYAALAAALFLPFTAYVGIACSENLALPFYLLSVYLFIAAERRGARSGGWLALCGLSLSLGNLLRMAGIPLLAAFLLYLFLIKRKAALTGGLVLILSFSAVYLAADAALFHSGVAEYHLWRGNEPAITSVLKGANLESGGAWNEADARLHEKNGYDYAKTEAAAKELLIQRFTRHPVRMAGLYLFKFFSQWSAGDFMGIFWSGGGQWLDSPFGFLLPFSQLFYALLCVFSQRAARRPHSPFVTLLCTALLLYAALYLISETQPRYSYIVCWLFVMLPFMGESRTMPVQRP